MGGDQLRQLGRSLLARANRLDQVVQLHPVRARRAPNQLEGFVDIEAVPLGDDPLCLLDADSRFERMLELRPALVGRVGDRQESSDGSRSVLQRSNLDVSFRQAVQSSAGAA